jgi:hypothetical protein
MYLNPTTLLSKKTFLMPINCNFFHLNPNAMLEIVTIDVDDECVHLPKKTRKDVTNVNCKTFGL